MSIDLINHATFPGITQVTECRYTCSHGAAPGQVTMTVPPDLTRLKEVGDVVISDGQGTLTVKGCKVVRPMGRQDASGQSITLLILDRRWRWEFAEPVSGRYNQVEEQAHAVPPLNKGLPAGNQPGGPPPTPKGEEPVKPRTRKTARELARICLKALGETRYNLDALDPNATPTVEWDVSPPAQALQQLAESLGCRLVYRPVQDDVVVAKLGDGAKLDDAPPNTSFTPGLEIKARPARLRLYGARTRVQMRFALEPVCMEFDGSIRPADEVSYAPDGGWKNSGPPTYAGVKQTGLPAGRTWYDAMALAQQWAFRAYRIKATGADGKGTLQVPPNDKSKTGTKRREQVWLLPLKNETARDDLGNLVTLSAACYGRHTPPSRLLIGNQPALTYGDTDADTEVKVPFTVVPEQQMIVFAQPVRALRDGKNQWPDIVLETACEFTDDADQFVRWTRDMKLAGEPASGVGTVVRDDVAYQIVARYDGGTAFQDAADNRKAVEGRADYYLRGEARRYEVSDTADVSYIGIRTDLAPDGAIQQISWSIGGPGPTTTASRNGEHALYLPSYEARRRIEANAIPERQRADAVEQGKRRTALDRVRRMNGV